MMLSSRRRQPALLLSLWLFGLIGASLLPWRAKAHLHTFAHSQDPSRFDFHRLLHLAAFGVTTLLLFGLVRLWWVAALLSLGLGLGTELLESVVFPNHLEWADVRDDGFGTVAALVLLLIFYRSSAPSQIQKS